MKGDFSRISFDPRRQYSRVLMQQGRLFLDADWNEQVSILLHRLEVMIKDIFGPYAGPEGPECGFGIDCDAFSDDNARDFHVDRGRYYVDGLLCENLSRRKYSDLLGGAAPTHDEPCLVYLDAWEHYVSAVEAPTSVPALREVALGGTDTTGRARIVWRLRTLSLDPKGKAFQVLTDKEKLSIATLAETWQADPRLHPKLGQLHVRVKKGANESVPRGEQRMTGYRGPENQLYRVEIHAEGEAGTATFKWSRDIGSVVFPVADRKGEMITLATMGRDTRFSLRAGDWVEAGDGSLSAIDTPRPLLEVVKIDLGRAQVWLSAKDQDPFPGGFDASRRPFLRRWDHKAGQPSRGGLTLKEGAAAVDESKWLSLEDGIEIRFEKGRYRTCDYWLIPARTAHGGIVEWPGGRQGSSQPPHGIEHHYAPLAVISRSKNKREVINLRLMFKMPIGF
jgi:hypothetical protein